MGIKFREVDHLYKGIDKKKNFAAIKNIDLDIEGCGELIAVCGKTGSGKSTLIQHMNALLTPTKGEIEVFDTKVYSNPKKNKRLSPIRKRVGLVFQFPEYQLFEETVLKDIMFGPLNYGLTKEEAEQKARLSAKMIGITDDLLDKSPFRLSGGQMRRVAIAGILAMEPDILVLDEPTRGLDPQGKVETMNLFMDIYEKYNKTIILITHDMDIVAEYAKRIIVMKEGVKVYDGTKEELFIHPQFSTFHLDEPMAIKLAKQIKERLNLKINTNIFSLNELINELKR